MATGSRPIAPAPTNTQTVPMSISAGHFLGGMQKIPVQQNVVVGSLDSSQSAPINLSAVQAASAAQPMPGSHQLGLTSQALGSQQHLHQQVTSRGGQEPGPAAVLQGSAVSLIKQTQQSAATPQEQRAHVIPANVMHLPQGIAMTTQKRPTAVLRNQVTGTGLSGVQSLTSRPLSGGVRPTTPATPPVTRSSSPSVNVAAAAGAQINQDALRTQLVHTTNTTATTVQITIQQPRDMPPRHTLITQLPAKTGASQTAQVLPHNLAQSKVIMSHASLTPMIQPTFAKAGGQTLPLGPAVTRSQRLVIPPIQQGKQAVTLAGQQLQMNKVIMQQGGGSIAPIPLGQRAIKVSTTPKISTPVMARGPHKMVPQVVSNLTGLGKTEGGALHATTLPTVTHPASSAAVPIAKVNARQYVTNSGGGHSELTVREGQTIQVQSAAAMQNTGYLGQPHRNSPAPATPAQVVVSSAPERRTSLSMYSGGTTSSVSEFTPNLGNNSQQYHLPYQNILTQTQYSRIQAPAQVTASQTVAGSGRVVVSNNLIMDAQRSVAGAVERGGVTAHPDGTVSAVITSKPSQMSASIVTQNTIASPSNQNPTQSPRPTILRKRNDGISTSVAKKNLIGSLSAGTTDGENNIPLITSKVASSLDPSRDNSQSSTDTASSSDSAASAELRLREGDGTENGASLSSKKRLAEALNAVEASPRKKPRKQLLQAQTDFRDQSDSATDEELERISASAAAAEQPAEPNSKLDEVHQALLLDEEYVDADGVRWISERRRPNITLLNHYQVGWKSKPNHFLRYQDVRAKEERRPTVNELSNQKHIIQKASGWKLYHLAAQFEEMIKSESELYTVMSSIQEAVAPKHLRSNMEDDVGMVHELSQRNIQRCKLVIDQLQEAKNNMLQVLDHKAKIMDIIGKHRSKRPVKKKER